MAVQQLTTVGYRASSGAETFSGFVTLDLDTPVVASNPEPSVTPEAAAPKALKKNSEIELGLDAKKFPRGTSEIVLGNLAAGEWFYVYLNDAGPGWHQAPADGTLSVNTPDSTRPGNNKVVVFDAAGTLHGWSALKVTGPPVK